MAVLQFRVFVGGGDTTVGIQSPLLRLPPSTCSLPRRSRLESKDGVSDGVGYIVSSRVLVGHSHWRHDDLQLKKGADRA